MTAGNSYTTSIYICLTLKVPNYDIMIYALNSQQLLIRPSALKNKNAPATYMMEKHMKNVCSH